MRRLPHTPCGESHDHRHGWSDAHTRPVRGVLSDDLHSSGARVCSESAFGALLLSRGSHQCRRHRPACAAFRRSPHEILLFSMFAHLRQLRRTGARYRAERFACGATACFTCAAHRRRGQAGEAEIGRATVRTQANKSVETNRRPASPFNGWRQFESASCAPPSLSAAVAHLWRYAI
jgi:hypothetical protein